MQSEMEFKNYVTEGVRTLRNFGLAIRWGDDFSVFKRLIERNQERYVPAPGFDHEIERDVAIDGLWLAAFNGRGELVHTQASRRVNVEPNMKVHLKTGASAYEPAYLRFDLENMDVNLSPSAEQVSGPAIYHGEAWLKGGPNGVRGGALLFIFSRMMIAQAFARWDVEHIFGLITPNTGVKGLSERYGYMRCEQGAITFPKAPDLPTDLWLVWMKREEARHQLRLLPDYFAEMYEQKDVAKVA